MINLTDALAIASSYLNDINMGRKVVILKQETVEFELGWVFFYQSEEYVRTGNFIHMLGGNAPIIVDKRNGKATETGTANDTQYYIDEYIKNAKVN